MREQDILHKYYYILQIWLIDSLSYKMQWTHKRTIFATALVSSRWYFHTHFWECTLLIPEHKFHIIIPGHKKPHKCHIKTPGHGTAGQLDRGLEASSRRWRSHPAVRPDGCKDCQRHWGKEISCCEGNKLSITGIRFWWTLCQARRVHRSCRYSRSSLTHRLSISLEDPLVNL